MPTTPDQPISIANIKAMLGDVNEAGGVLEG